MKFFSMAMFLAMMAVSAVSTHAAPGCLSHAKGEGIEMLGDQVDIPCNERSAKVSQEETYQGVTGFHVTMTCSRQPEEIWVYLTDDCQDASSDQSDAYLKHVNL